MEQCSQTEGLRLLELPIPLRDFLEPKMIPRKFLLCRCCGPHGLGEVCRCVIRAVSLSQDYPHCLPREADEQRRSASLLRY